jgi:hypothetical protein
VERLSSYIRQDFFVVPKARMQHDARTFRNLDDLNAQLDDWLATVANARVHGTTQRVVAEAFAAERPGAGAPAGAHTHAIRPCRAEHRHWPIPRSRPAPPARLRPGHRRAPGHSGRAVMSIQANSSLLDRLLHHATVIQIEGSSYRLRWRADLVPDNVRARPNINAPAQPRRRGQPPGTKTEDPEIG